MEQQPPPPKPADTAAVVQVWLERIPGQPLTADTVEAMRSVYVFARGRLSTGGALETVAGTWQSSDPSVVSLHPMLSPSYEVRANAPGTAVVTFRSQAHEARLTVVVRQASVASVTIHVTEFWMAPRNPDSLLVGTVLQYRARTLSAGGSPLAGRTVTWASSDTSVFAVNDTGVVTARRVGTATLTALSEGKSASLGIAVRPPLAARIAFTYAPDTLYSGSRDSVRAVLYDSAGLPMPVRPKIEVSSFAFFDITGGWITGGAPGVAELVASGDGLTVRRPLVVRPPPPARLDVVPGTLALPVTTAARLRVVLRDINGRPMSGIPFRYAVDDPAIAAIDANGLVTARALGRTTVRVRADTIATTVAVDVLPPSAFEIEMRWPAGTDFSPINAGSDAATRWASVVVGDLPDMRVQLPADACGPGTPTTELVIDDVLVLARVERIDGDGNTVAMAGPCVLREDGTTAVGELIVDAADVSSLSSRDLLRQVLRHEVGHVLGIGTLWSQPSRALVAQLPSGWWYVGPRVRRAAAIWGLDATAGVKLGEASEPGDGHWAEFPFQRELMSPLLGVGEDILSLLTVEALGEIGYLVAASGADLWPDEPFATGTLSAARLPLRDAATSAGVPLVERTIAPRWRVDRGGRVQRIAP